MIRLEYIICVYTEEIFILLQLQETNTVLSEGAKGFCVMVSQIPTIPKPTEPNTNDK